MIFTLTNPKTIKGEALGYLTAVLHLAPARIGGTNVCPYSSPGCRASCLNTAGHGGIGLEQGANPVQAARIGRTRAWHADAEAFTRGLASDLARLSRRAAARHLHLAVRLNGTSDIPWELVRAGTHVNLMQQFPEIRFYDYTKWPLERRHLELTPGNYALTFSLSEKNGARAERALLAGFNVAVVFDTRGEPLPARCAIGGVDAPVIDGDMHDLRFLDPAGPDGRGVIVGLRAKGRGKRDTTGFVRRIAARPDGSLRRNPRVTRNEKQGLGGAVPGVLVPVMRPSANER
jgi:hypothetical protein